MAPAQHPFRGEIRLSPKLNDAFGQLIGMGLFLNGMLEKLGLHAKRIDPAGHEVMAFVAQDTDDFRGQGFVQQPDHRPHFGLVARCHGTIFNPLPGLGPERLHIGQTDGFFDDSFLSRSAGCR